MLVLRHHQERQATEPTITTSDDPLLRLQREIEAPHDGEIHWRSTRHPEELAFAGIITICARCGARRDWMLICIRNQVSIRCRCGHQWVEPELSRAAFDAMITTRGTVFDSLEAAVQASGFDGTLADTYLLPRRPK